MTRQKRQSPRMTANVPISMHFFGEQIDTTVSEDVSQQGFFVRTETVRALDVGVVVVMTIHHENQPIETCMAEVVRVTHEGAAFHVIERDV